MHDIGLIDGVQIHNASTMVMGHEQVWRPTCCKDERIAQQCQSQELQDLDGVDGLVLLQG
jgi:hypothetical protein